VETLETVLERRAHHFVRIFVSQFGFTEERAQRFVNLAGSDLIECCRWHERNMGPGGFSAPANVRNLLAVIHARRIADSLGIPSAEVWSGLRVFVPRVLQLADGRAAHEA
jgi:hypothetical protein